MAISQIKIRNIKGISHQNFKVNLEACKPNLLVAPNGFGKSSIATAFSSMNSKRIVLEEKDFHKEDENLNPELSISVDGQTLVANQEKNDIRQQFDVLVVNCGLTPKAKRHFRGSVSSSLEVKPITICKIPAKADFPYRYSELKRNFGRNGKILPNITTLLTEPSLLEIIRDADLSKFTQVKLQKALSSIIDEVNQQDGTAQAIEQWIVDNHIDNLRAISLLNSLAERLSQLDITNSEVEAFLTAYQIACVYSADKKKFNEAADWLNYTAIKAHYKQLLSKFKSSEWQWAKVEEIRKHKSLIVSFPQAQQLSNGQRDIITLVVQLHQTLYEGSKKPLILVIDEVFDYLDDANLVAFQYYITSIIEAYKERNQTIYPVILTHLDPGVFFDFCFNKHKIKVSHLQNKPIGKSQNTLRLIEARDNQLVIQERLEKHWFHFHTDGHEIPANEWPNNLPQNWRSAENFTAYVNSELQRYLNDRNYDPLAVCFACRIAIEKLTYSQLGNAPNRNKFLLTKKTKNKLEYAVDLGTEIPESYFLLGLIYNTNLHWVQGRDYVSPLASKLSHPTIKQLIAGIAE